MALPLLGSSWSGRLLWSWVLSSQRWVRLSAVGIPVLMLLGMLAVTPTALGNKLDSQYEATPQCWWEEENGEGPGMEAARDSQRAFDSIEHVGYFSGGGAVGVAGCDLALVVLDDIDVVQHYRTALPDAGWQVVEDDGQRLRAERGDMAFEEVMCSRAAACGQGRSPTTVQHVAQRISSHRERLARHASGTRERRASPAPLRGTRGRLRSETAASWRKGSPS